MLDRELIPATLIGHLSNIVPDFYSASRIRSLFESAGAPPTADGINKSATVNAYLKAVNEKSDQPMKILAVILDDFFERRAGDISDWKSRSPSELANALETAKSRIRDALAKKGLTYLSGNIVSPGTSATLSLLDQVKLNGLATIEVEIKRGLETAEQDPHAAAHYAGNVLEAAIKAYLDHKSVAFSDRDTIDPLWKKAAEAMGLNAVDPNDQFLQKIASGLGEIVTGIAGIRNKGSAAHGRSEAQSKTYAVAPRHARLALHSAHTLAAYLVELTDS